MSGSERKRRSPAEVQAEREAAAERKQRREAEAARRFQRENAPRAVDAIATRLEERARREDAERRAAKAARKAKAARGEMGPKVAPGTKTVDDPMQPGQKLKATVNLAEHPLELMLARRRLTQAQYEAGIRFRAIYEHAMIGPGRGIDPAKIKVDGGKMGDPLSDAVLHAHYELRRILPRLGKNGSSFVIAICGLGDTVTEVAGRLRIFHRPQSNRDFVTGRLLEALDYLAEEVWGTKGSEHGSIVALRDLGSGDVDMQAVDTANQSYLRKRGIAI
jgi:hypothetical protein